MSNTVIKVEDISKQYRLGEIGTGSLAHDINRWWYKIRGKENPYLKIGETNDRTTSGQSDYVWSLKDITFDINQGDAVGIIGRNGAGKSTLLKILSRVTGPTTGSIKVKGRIASLLEVGTGFHPELSGRENIFLNGAILGMRKEEIKRKFDEIVDFAGVERYIDTPVKRYSSGMYVRLAFGVAAHLESEILIVDEVLAVGDAEFQKKCLGKMGEVSKGEGRTVLFVSHNMASIRALCNSGIMLKNGQLFSSGNIDDVLEKYILDSDPQLDVAISDIQTRIGDGALRFTHAELLNIDNEVRYGFLVGETMEFRIFFDSSDVFKVAKTSRIDIDINDMNNNRVTWLSSSIYQNKVNCDNNCISFLLSKILLTEGKYQISLYSEYNGIVSDFIVNVLSFEVLFNDFYGTGVVPQLRNINAISEFTVLN